MYRSGPVCFHLKVCPVGNVRGNESSDFPKLRGTHFSLWLRINKSWVSRVWVSDLLGLFEEREADFGGLERWVFGVGGVEGTDEMGRLRFMRLAIEKAVLVLGLRQSI